MSDARNLLLEWAARGALSPAKLEAAMHLGGVVPDHARWRRFVDSLLLWPGAALLGAALVFFLAYNWDAMGRYLKFALAEGAIVLALAGVLWRGVDAPSGKALLLAASLFTGALLALVGQTYQTGADPWELFAVWALCMLPWTLLSRLAAQWLLALGLLNLSVLLYYQTFLGFPLLGALFGPMAPCWVLLALNGMALAVWEFARLRGGDWLKPRWPLQLIGAAVMATATVLGLWAAIDAGRESLTEALGWAGCIALVYAVYRRRQRDLFMLAMAALSVVMVVNTWLGRQLVESFSDPRILLVSASFLASSTLAARWLQRVAREAAP